MNTEMTGVLRAERGQGMATQLKLCGIRYAQGRGNLRLWTVNDSANAGVIGLNRKLGFKPEGAIVRYTKRVVPVPGSDH